jgi:UDP-glucose 4-epimerase
LKVLVTGIAGFMGSHLAEKLLQDDHEVIGIDNLIGGYLDNVPEGSSFHEADLLDLSATLRFFKDVDVVVHTACTAYEGLSVFSPSYVSANTYQITASALSASISSGVRKFVFMSSMARYGSQASLPFIESMTPRPQDPYGIAKYAAELLVANASNTHGMEYSILVPHNIIGPRQKYDDPFRNVASIMINRMLQGKQPIIYGTGEQKRCFSFIDDVIDPILKVVNTDSANSEVINIGPDEEFISINELAKIISEILSFELQPIYVPSRPQEVEFANCSAEKARDLLGYKTSVNLRDGLQSLANWIKEKGAKEFEYHLPLEIINESTPETWVKKLI